MKKIRKKVAERRNIIRSHRQERIYPFLERLIEERLTDLYKAFLDSQGRCFGAVLDRISELESFQMDLIKIQSALTKKLFPDYVPVREQAHETVKGYHETFLN